MHLSLLALYALGGFLVSRGLMPIRILLSAIGFTFSLVFATQGLVQTLSDVRRVSGSLDRWGRLEDSHLHTSPVCPQADGKPDKVGSSPDWYLSLSMATACSLPGLTSEATPRTVCASAAWAPGPLLACLCSKAMHRIGSSRLAFLKQMPHTNPLRLPHGVRGCCGTHSHTATWAACT